MNILHGIKLLDDLSQADRDNLSLFCQEKMLKRGELIFKEGDDANAMYILKSGKIEIIKNLDGKDVVLGRVEAEEILGEMALFGDDNKRMATAITIDDSELITILSFSIKELTRKNPLLLEKIKDIINDRVIDNKIIESTVR